MSASSPVNKTLSQTIVIDAGIGVKTVLPIPTSLKIIDTFTQWREAQIQIYAPAFWLIETTSVIRRYVHAGMISSHEGKTALDDLIDLKVELIDIQPSHCHTALSLAGTLNQAKAYDSFYLAVALDLSAHFYSTDKRLVNGARQQGFDWVHYVAD